MSSENIFTPRVCVDMMLACPRTPNKSICTKIPYKGYQISIAMDSSHGDGDLFRSDILVYDELGANVTRQVVPELSEGGIVYANADALKEIFAAIDELVSVPA